MDVTRRQRSRFFGDRDLQSGQAMVEFVLAFPIQLVLVLGIIQLSLLLIGRQVLHYAAYSAARSALVYDSDPALASSSAQRAAAMVCTCIAGPSGGETGREISVPGWGPAGGSDRLRYDKQSDEKTHVDPTDVRFEETDNAGSVAVLVRHDFELLVPIAGPLFAGSSGSFGPVGGSGPANEKTLSLWQRLGRPHLVLEERVVLPRPWK